jgi:hydrophobic/amphiphilic exporter-1 (mainly G- bacteria), HAE1 family
VRFAHFFVDRPIFATVLSIVIVIIGAIAYTTLPISEYPEIAPPTIVVRATYPGADAATVAATVATPIEQEVNGVENMLYMSSYSTSDGAMGLTITFKPGTNLDTAQVLTQNRVAIAAPRLPEEVRRLGVTTLKSSPDLMLVVHMLSPDNTYDQLYISNYAKLRVRDALLRLDGVGDIRIFGEREYAARVWLDPEKMAAYSLNSADVVRALQEQNVQVSGGALGQEPAPTSNPLEVVVTTQGRFDDIRQFRNVIVRATSDGRLIRVQDVARVEFGAREYVTNSYLNGQPAVALVIFQRPGTNALQAAEEILAKMNDLKRDFPPGIDYRVVYNPTEFIAQSVDEVYKTLFEAILLVALVVIVFLQKWRAALIPILAIPVSLIGTFAVMAALGFSLNVLTLFGLVLAIGIVVDDAIVVVENVERNIAQGLSPRDAAHETIDEVGTAVIAIAVVLSAVFIPTAFIPGISGQFFRQFALTIATATILSAINSLTLSPALAAVLLQKHEHAHERRGLGKLTGWLADRFNGGFDKMSNGYGRGVGWVARRKAFMLLIYVGLAALTVFTFMKVPSGFIPQLDRGYAIVVVQLPDGASLSRTDAVIKRASEIMKETPGVRNAVAFAGFSGATFTNASNTGVIFAGLEPFEDRVKNGLSAGQIIGNLFGRLQSIQEAFIIAVPPPAVPGIGNSGGFKLQIQNRTDDNMAQVLTAAQHIIGQASQTPDVMGVYTTFSTSSPQLFLEIDRTKAQMLNVPISAIFDALQVNLGSAYVNDFNAFGRVYQVRAQADQRFRLETADIMRLKVRSANGALVPLGTLVNVVDKSGPTLVQRYNMYVSVPIQGSAAPGTSSGEALAKMEQLSANLPPGMGYEWTELSLQEKLTGNTAIYVFILAVVFVFLALAAQYESWVMPLSIMLIVPMCVLAALGGISLMHMQKDILVEIGLIVLVGLAAKNAILIVEFARRIEGQEHKTPVEAVIEACRLRLRPILMTAFAFILGVLPLAIATGPGAEMRQSLGVAVFAGMLGVTAIGLFFTPVFYVALRLLVLRKAKPKAAPSPAE